MSTHEAKQAALQEYYRTIQTWDAGEVMPGLADVLLLSGHTLPKLEQHARQYRENQSLLEKAAAADEQADSLDLQIAQATVDETAARDTLARKRRRHAELVESDNSKRVQQYPDIREKLSLIAEQCQRLKDALTKATETKEELVRHQMDLRAAADEIRQRIVQLPGEPQAQPVPRPNARRVAEVYSPSASPARRGITFETATELMELPNMTLQHVARMLGLFDERGEPCAWQAECESLSPGFIINRIPGWRHPTDVEKERAVKEDTKFRARLAKQQEAEAEAFRQQMDLEAGRDSGPHVVAQSRDNGPETAEELLRQGVGHEQVARMRGLSMKAVDALAAQIAETDEKEAKEFKRQHELKLLQEV